MAIKDYYIEEWPCGMNIVHGPNGFRVAFDCPNEDGAEPTCNRLNELNDKLKDMQARPDCPAV